MNPFSCKMLGKGKLLKIFTCLLSIKGSFLYEVIMSVKNNLLDHPCWKVSLS